jgi:hypothetical protein
MQTLIHPNRVSNEKTDSDDNPAQSNSHAYCEAGPGMEDCHVSCAELSPMHPKLCRLVCWRNTKTT